LQPLQAKVEDYHRTMTFKTGELLPSDYWGAPPQVLIVTVSPFGKIYQHASEAFKGDEHLKTMAQGLTKGLPPPLPPVDSPPKDEHLKTMAQGLTKGLPPPPAAHPPKNEHFKAVAQEITRGLPYCSPQCTHPLHLTTQRRAPQDLWYRESPK